MTIYIPLDDFLFNLFPDCENELQSVLRKLKQFYSINGNEPTITQKANTIEIVISDSDISKEHAAYNKLISLCEKGNLKVAKELASDLTTKSPAISEYHRLLGQICSDLGYKEEAVDALIDALRWDPENEYALIMMGNIYAREYNDIETAMRYYDQVVKINPKDNIALNNIGANLLREGKKVFTRHHHPVQKACKQAYTKLHCVSGLFAPFHCVVLRIARATFHLLSSRGLFLVQSRLLLPPETPIRLLLRRI
jgi:tetratricopeptide (TPR) repeat protein